MICVEDPDYVTLASVVASYGLSTSAYSGNERAERNWGILVAHGAGG